MAYKERIEDPEIIKIMNMARRVEISTSEATRKMEEHYGVVIPPFTPKMCLLGINFGELIRTYDEKVGVSGLEPEEYHRRVGIILHAQEILFTERVHERYARKHNLSGRLIPVI